MKNLILLPILCCTAYAVDDRFVDAVAQIESSGRSQVVGDNGLAVGMFQMHREAWEQVSSMRAKKKLPTYDYALAKNPVISHIYAKAYLDWIEGRLAKTFGRQPEPWEIYAGYNRGLGGFADAGHDFDNLPKHTQRACSRLSSLLSQDSTKKH